MGITPCGIYYGMLENFEIGMSSPKTGEPKPVAVLTFRVLHRKVNEDWVSIEPSFTRYVTLYLTPEGKKYTFEKLQKLGYTGSLAEGQLDRFDPEILQGIELICEHETYNDRSVERWSAFCWMGGGNYKPNKLAETDAAILDNEFKNFLANSQVPTM
jgi:hypothetical protein